ncbi:arylsulfatase F-like [Palaemon carinicauda]|uniref:arylsulfatase F-like n=1 Tax=Palaemon carinicauda TaxID=392227 RepID=UPI0035B584B9
MKKESIITLLTAVLATALTKTPLVSAARKSPNILVILADDLGIGDVGCYGNDTIRTPNLDRLAAGGVKLTHHLAAAAVCTPSRAALMTGRYPSRYGLTSDERMEVPIIPHLSTKVTLPLDEVTIAAALRAANYTTAIVGKWHLGMHCSLFGLSCPGPLLHGFQTFYGIPVTLFLQFGDIQTFWKFPVSETKYQTLVATWLLCVISLYLGRKRFNWGIVTFVFLLVLTNVILFVVWFFVSHVGLNKGTHWGVSPWLHKHGNSMILRQDKVVESPIELDGLSQRLVSESRQFLRAHAKDEKPFFLFHSMAHVHTPMFTAPHMKGVSKHGRYGDNVEEMDESIGALLDSLREFGLEENTIVYFTSDHGGALESIDHDGQRIGGHNGLFKGGKLQGSSEGGIRVAGIYSWPGHLPAGRVVDTPTSLLDLLPTVLDLAQLPPMQELVPHASDKDLDGQSIAELLLKGDVTPPKERIMLHHCCTDIRAIRLTRGNHVYKMHLGKVKWHQGSTQCGWGRVQHCRCYGDAYHQDISHEPELYDLSFDPYEDHPISPRSNEYKEIVGYLQQYMKEWKANVVYPPSPMSTVRGIMWRPLHQPFCLFCRDEVTISE